MAFEREYKLVSIPWNAMGGDLSFHINAAIRQHDHIRAAASVACMSTDGAGVHILIEAWREDGDSEQDTKGAVDAQAAHRKPRRARARTNDDAGTTSGMEPEGVHLPLEQATVTGPG